MADGVWITGQWSVEGLIDVRVFPEIADAIVWSERRAAKPHVWFVPWGEDTGDSQWWADSWDLLE